MPFIGYFSYLWKYNKPDCPLIGIKLNIMIEQVSRTFDLLGNLKKNFPTKSDILSKKTGNDWIKYSVDDYCEYAHLVACAFAKLGYGKNDKVITICNNRPEWNFTDFGSNMAGMIHVPVFPTLSQDDFLYIFNHSEAKIIMLGTRSQYNSIEPIIRKMDKPARIILMDDSDSIECMRDLYELARKYRSEMDPVIEKRKNDIKTDDIASIIYTSGTTGRPKGVMLSHQNLMFNAYGHAKRQNLGPEHKMLSFLPLCHVYERSMNYEYQYVGISIYYAEGLGTIARDLEDCHADGFCAVPRVLEMMYSKLESAGKNLKGIKKTIYSKAWKFGNNFDNNNNGWLYRYRHELYDKLVYSKWREKLGGHEMLIVSGGSSIQAKIVRLFNAAKLRIFEGYGMTETSPVIAVNSPADGYNVIGTVGQALEGTELKIAEDGEILTRGPHVMKGYFKNPEATAEVIDSEGFMHTGDIGEFVNGKYLRITDRKKEIFKLSLGKYIAPQVIENMLRESPYIDNCIVIGENQKFVSSIIIPNIEKLHFWAAKHNIAFENNQQLIDEPKIIAKLHTEIENVNEQLAHHERIKREKIIYDEWTTGNGMLSQTQKLKRSAILSKYDSLIKEIYKR